MGAQAPHRRTKKKLRMRICMKFSADTRRTRKVSWSRLWLGMKPGATISTQQRSGWVRNGYIQGHQDPKRHGHLLRLARSCWQCSSISMDHCCWSRYWSVQWSMPNVTVTPYRISDGPSKTNGLEKCPGVYLCSTITHAHMLPTQHGTPCAVLAGVFWVTPLTAPISSRVTITCLGHWRRLWRAGGSIPLRWFVRQWNSGSSSNPCPSLRRV
jgi:hypothetical protein